MSDPKPVKLGPHDVLAPEAVSKIERKRVPLYFDDANGKRTQIGEADAWVEDGEIRMQGTISDQKYGLLISGAHFSTEVDFTASHPLNLLEVKETPDIKGDNNGNA